MEAEAAARCHAKAMLDALKEAEAELAAARKVIVQQNIAAIEAVQLRAEKAELLAMLRDIDDGMRGLPIRLAGLRELIAKHEERK